jgi:hypothetical protein
VTINRLFTAKPSLWVIELHNGEDSRLTKTLIDDAFKPALDAVEKHWRALWREAKTTKHSNGGGGALIIVGKRNQNKFFSNGRSCTSCVGVQDVRLNGIQDLTFPVSQRTRISFLVCMVTIRPAVLS